MFKKGTMLTVLLVAGALGATGGAQQSATSKAQDNVAEGDAAVISLLPLMEQDKDGNVSKQEFMRFMGAEFNRLDKKNDGKLDVKELTKTPATPIKGFRK
jgi:Ca2+-binding EF-hand superfamily protein